MNMKNEKILVNGLPVGIRHEMRQDPGRQIVWASPDGNIRIPIERNRDFFYPGPFTAAGRIYPGWKALCFKLDESGYLATDIYGREVFCIMERFPCFDSYDYAHENRYYWWLFIKEKGKLTRIYHADGTHKIQVTEDVRNLEDKCWQQMKKMDWLR